ncbi:dephospho-CoA kinase [Jatrophihabitans sp. DSM 45814]
MKFVSLSGSIGSGKSTVAALLSKRGAAIIDVDRLSRQLQRPGLPLFDALRSRWGDAILAADGCLDREALGRIVFTDLGQLAELTKLIGPATDAEIIRQASAHVNTDRVVVLESALSTRAMYGTTGLVVVAAPESVTIARLVEQRGMTEQDARARSAAQARLPERLHNSDFVVENTGDLEELERQVELLWLWIRTTPDAVARPERDIRQ